MPEKSSPPQPSDDPVSPIDQHDFTDDGADGYAESVRSISSRRDPFADPTSLERVDSDSRSISAGGSLSSDDAVSPSPVSRQSTPRFATRNPSLLARTISMHSTTSDVPHSPTEQGPSHPYGMYPQELAVSRSASIATASTLRPTNRTSNSNQDPSHAYGSYPQTIQLEPLQTGQGAYPIGFPGHEQRFHRRLGPEGEEQDIVGADGHTEQLPPYSRYPLEQDSKSSGASNLPVIGESSSSPAQTQTPVSSSDVPERSAPPPSTGFSSDGDTLGQNNRSNVNLTSSESGTAEKASWREKTWKQRAKFRVCGFLPLWILTLILVVIVVICVICGIVISVFIYKNRDGHSNIPPPAPESAPPYIPSTTTSYLDAAPIPTPSDLPSLPFGSWTVPFGGPVMASNTCLNNTLQGDAWTCRFPQNNVFYVTLAVDGNIPILSSSYLGPHLLYGERPPQLTNQPLALVTDLENETLGDAFHFQTFYDKLVILPSTALTASEPLPTYHQPTEPSGHKDTEAHPAWFCFWNHTFIEGFIYINDHAVQTASETGTGRYPQSSYNPYPSSSSWKTATTTSPPPVYGSSQHPSATNIPKSTPNPASQPSQNPYSNSHMMKEREAPGKPQLGQATFPKRLKFLERRLDGQHPAPYCELMSIGWLGTLEPMSSTQGGPPIRIELDENDPTISEQTKEIFFEFGGQSMEPRRKQHLKFDDSGDYDLGCYCQWMV